MMNNYSVILKRLANRPNDHHHCCLSTLDTPSEMVAAGSNGNGIGNGGAGWAGLSSEVVLPLAINAVNGLMRALSLGTRRWSSAVTQDMLCILRWVGEWVGGWVG